MDIRVAAYSPVTVSTQITTRSNAGGATATTYVQNAAQSGPIPAVQAAPTVQNQIAANPNDGYTDSVRGSLINILA